MRTTATQTLRRVALPLATVAVLALAGCGSRGDSGSSGSAPASGTVVTVSKEAGQRVLVDSGGRALYVSDQEKGKVLCTSGACGAIWTPLTVPSKQRLDAPAPLAHELGTIGRPDGTTQVTLAGRPLYTFSFDHAPGDVNGDGQQDSFDGTDFTWHVATPTGHVGMASGKPSSPAPSSGYGNGGYNY